ncbi:MAG: ArdC family protein, partial [Sulfobacillus sp.]
MNAQDAQALVDQGIQQLLDDPEQWKQWADTMAQFPKYSPGNALLILSQRPDATMVAGFHAWQKLDRHVMKGEHGMTIIAPVVRRKESAIEEAPSPTKSSVDAAPQR